MKYNDNRKRQDLTRLCLKVTIYSTADLVQRAAIVLLWGIIVSV